jgi:hypothetical protein
MKISGTFLFLAFIYECEKTHKQGITYDNTKYNQYDDK